MLHLRDSLDRVPGFQNSLHIILAGCWFRFVTRSMNGRSFSGAIALAIRKRLSTRQSLLTLAVIAHILPIALTLPIQRIKVLVLVPVRNGNDVIDNLNHSQFLKPGQGHANGVEISPENSSQQFIGICNAVSQPEYTISALLTSQSQELEPDNNDSISLRQGL